MFKFFISSILIFAASLVFAEPITLMGTETHTITIQPSNNRTNKGLHAALPVKKLLTLMSFKLGSDAHDKLMQRVETFNLTKALGIHPRAKQLGMNGVPVLDQGPHGSCVTFAATAAVDAAFNLGDEVSQLCQLELGSYLEKVGYTPSGWDGSFAHIVLNQMSTFGVVSKTHQMTEGCGGLIAYPGQSYDTPENIITPEEFHAAQKDKRLFDPVVFWYPILHVNQIFYQPTDTENVLESVKNSIDAGDRVVFGSFLISPMDGLAGAVGTHNVHNDTWILTEKLREDLYTTMDFAGHEMAITGYDDAATIVDENGKVHRGLLTIRNSWGSEVGDAGNFYMSYEYFANLVIEAHRIFVRPFF